MLGRTTPGRVRTGRTIGDCSPSAWTFGTSQVDIMKHHSCGPRPSTTVPGRPSPLPCTNMSHPVGPAVPKTALLPLGWTERTTASRPVPSGALGSLPAGPRRAPGRLGTLRAGVLVGVVEEFNPSSPGPPGPDEPAREKGLAIVVSSALLGGRNSCACLKGDDPAYQKARPPPRSVAAI